MDKNRPMGRKNYGSIGHLEGSKLGSGEHTINTGQQRILTEKTRDKHDTVFVTEKLDGTNVGVYKKDGEIYPVQRSGYAANTSPFKMHHWFYDWAMERKSMFLYALEDGERLCGEWMAQAHGTRYCNIIDPFVCFDLMREAERATQEELIDKAGENFRFPARYHKGEAFSLMDARKCMGVSLTGAIDNVEGVVYRVERKGKVDFLAKYVRPDHVTGCYLPNISGSGPVFNWVPNGFWDERSNRNSLKDKT